VDSTCQASGIGVSPGLGHGELHVDVDDALDSIEAGRPVVLALETSSPADVPAMIRASGIISGDGDAASHAAIVATAAGVPAVLSVRGLSIGPAGIEIGGLAIGVGDRLTIDGDTGTVRWGAQ
jgi:pyruvate,orthophosphate dikinase